MSEVATSLSLPEALLLIRQEQQRHMEWLRWHTQSRTLAAAAIWNKSAASALARFERALRDADAPKDTPPKDLSRLYRQAGVPVKSTTTL